MYQKILPIVELLCDIHKFEERGGLSSIISTVHLRCWLVLPRGCSFSVFHSKNTLLERITGIRIGFRCDPLIECAAQNLADKFIDDKGRDLLRQHLRGHRQAPT